MLDFGVKKYGYELLLYGFLGLEAPSRLAPQATALLRMGNVAAQAVRRLADEEAPSKGRPVAARNMFLDHIDESAGATIMEGFNRSDTRLRAVQFRLLGGAISRVAPDETAYATASPRS